ncbi:MAG: hypothetical protein A2297_10235 [Elusimicrobia bacterium RIFOXYB2_FULL_48_7]|nr:MAG: hypothetical protein A2297_10235 [Elusimicrobia bacterium RIFOXYB2_FULL_48_7]
MKAGDREAFGKIIDMYADKIYSMCYYSSKNKSEADDLFQEVFLKAFQSINNFSRESNFSTWLYRITVNHCIDRGRHRNLVSFFSVEKNDEQGLTLEDKMPDSAPGPEQEAQKQEVNERLISALGRLNPRQRAAVLLMYFEEKSLKDISEIMDCSVGTVGSRLSYAFKKLRAYLKPGKKDNEL